jgi:hypothetical protein
VLEASAVVAGPVALSVGASVLASHAAARRPIVTTDASAVLESQRIGLGERLSAKR